MAKIRKWKLSWDPSPSDEVIGYKLYWARGSEVSYDAQCIKIGNVTEIALPDNITLSRGPVMFGVTAVDRDGNESDMVTLAKPYRLKVPPAPTGLAIRSSDVGQPEDVDGDVHDAFGNADRCSPPLEDDEERLARAIEEMGRSLTADSNADLRVQRRVDLPLPDEQ